MSESQIADLFELPNGKCPLLLTKTVRPFSEGDKTALKRELAEQYVRRDLAIPMTPETHPEEFERMARKIAARRVEAKRKAKLADKRAQEAEGLLDEADREDVERAREREDEYQRLIGEAQDEAGESASRADKAEDALAEASAKIAALEAAAADKPIVADPPADPKKEAAEKEAASKKKTGTKKK